ncbi:iron-containing alcohol dehydrogenase [Kitasatospora camelliae]|uniref:Iron-containing alcohol dehydrogenase n=1 Tax=Kitasatospora camelliae TaxID=3156397 RepID=A0AAU8JV93_9ACTN
MTPQHTEPSDRPSERPAERPAPKPADRTAEAVAAVVANALRALREYDGFTQEKVDRIVRKAALAALAAHVRLAALAVEETGRGVLEDQAAENRFACERVARGMAGVRTVGVVRRDELDGIVEIADPVGVVAALTPAAGPTATVLFQALIALKTRNPVVFSFHPGAPRCSAEAARTVRDAAVAAGAPASCVQWVEPASAAAGALTRHPDVALVLATGDPAAVRAAYGCGKPALGAEPGNVPAYLERSADLARAVNDVVLSRAFDHGLAPAAEQTVILDAAVHERALAGFRALGGHLVDAGEKALLERYLFGDPHGPGDDPGGVNPAAVGRSAAEVAAAAGFEVPAGTTVLLAEVAGVGDGEPLTRVKPCPVLAVLRAASRSRALRWAAELVELGGGGAAVVHTEDEAFAEEFGLAVRAGRVVWNAPGAQGAAGGRYNALPPALGPGGGCSGPAAVRADRLLNLRRLARRDGGTRRFAAPPAILFERGAVRALAELPGARRIVLVTDRAAVEQGRLERVREVLDRRADPVAVRVVDTVEPEPSVETVERGAELMRAFAPDTVIALGGRAPMDAAKAMWLLYAHPEAEFADPGGTLGAGLTGGGRARLVCVPTASGTGGEVAPFAEVTDPESGRRYPLADPALTPDLAVVDPALTADRPGPAVAEAAFAALARCVEAWISVDANDFTDGLARQGALLVVEHLPAALADGPDGRAARDRLHHAGTIAGLALGSASLGAVHALAHTLAPALHLPYGRVCALLLPPVVRHAGAAPARVTGRAGYPVYVAPERLAALARTLALPAGTPEQGVESLAGAVEELRERAGLPRSLKLAGVEESAFLEALPRYALGALEDRCAPGSPRRLLLADLERLLRRAYYGDRA